MRANRIFGLQDMEAPAAASSVVDPLAHRLGARGPLPPGRELLPRFTVRLPRACGRRAPVLIMIVSMLLWGAPGVGSLDTAELEAAAVCTLWFVYLYYEYCDCQCLSILMEYLWNIFIFTVPFFSFLF
jgi:hypothetical protein